MDWVETEEKNCAALVPEHAYAKPQKKKTIIMQRASPWHSQLQPNPLIKTLRARSRPRIGFSEECSRSCYRESQAVNVFRDRDRDQAIVFSRDDSGGEGGCSSPAGE